jgi:hypothetical protein
MNDNYKYELPQKSPSLSTGRQVGDLGVFAAIAAIIRVKLVT